MLDDVVPPFRLAPAVGRLCAVSRGRVVSVVLPMIVVVVRRATTRSRDGGGGAVAGAEAATAARDDNGRRWREDAAFDSYA